MNLFLQLGSTEANGKFKTIKTNINTYLELLDPLIRMLHNLHKQNIDLYIIKLDSCVCENMAPN